MKRRLWAVRGRETYVPLKPGNRRRAPRRGPFEWAADVAEVLVEGLLDFLFFWGRK